MSDNGGGIDVDDGTGVMVEMWISLVDDPHPDDDPLPGPQYNR